MFEEGMIVEYKHMTGTVCFIDDDYISICVNETPASDYIHRSCQCRAVVYRSNWDSVTVIRDLSK